MGDFRVIFRVMGDLSHYTKVSHYTTSHYTKVSHYTTSHYTKETFYYTKETYYYTGSAGGKEQHEPSTFVYMC
jgi:hypothetical protein